MPHGFQIDSKRDLLEETYTGMINLNMLIESNAAIIEHPDFRKGLKILTDLRGAQIPFGYLEMSTHVRFQPSLHFSKQAFIVTGRREYGMIRMFQTLAEDSQAFEETKVFESIEEGMKWLNL